MGHVSLTHTLVVRPTTTCYKILGPSLLLYRKIVRDELCLRGVVRENTVEGVGGVKTTGKTMFTEITITSSSKLLHQTIPVRTLASPLGSIQAVDWNQFKHYWPHLADIQFPNPIPNGRVDIIIGSDFPYLSEHLLTRRAALSNHAIPSPIAIYTRLGWSAGGAPLAPSV